MPGSIINESALRDLVREIVQEEVSAAKSQPAPAEPAPISSAMPLGGSPPPAAPLGSPIPPPPDTSSLSSPTSSQPLTPTEALSNLAAARESVQASSTSTMPPAVPATPADSANPPDMPIG